MIVDFMLPKKVTTNKELANLFSNWSEEKIFKKTGIAQRHIASESETATDLAEKAAKSLFEHYEVIPGSIDFLLLCTQSEDYKLPTSACLLQDRLGLPKSTGALDYNLGCSGYIYGLSLAKGLLVSGSAHRILLLTADTYTKYLHPLDKSVRTIFGDAAAATLLEQDDCGKIGSFVFGTDGAGAKHLILPCGGARKAIQFHPQEITDRSGNIRTENHLFMDGMEIFTFTLDVVPKMMKTVLARNNLEKGDIDLFVFHQANKFMLDTIRKTNLIPEDRFYVNMEDIGNTVSSSIPIALTRAEQDGVLKAGMHVMIMGFGVGLSWGATILTW